MKNDPTTRRRFLKTLAVAGAGAQVLLRSGDARAAVDAAHDVADDVAWPSMTYRRLGRTNFKASRLVFGCGAALSRGRKDGLLERAFDSGVNVFDVGFRAYYRNAEANLAPFLKGKRDQVFLISKAIVPGDVKPGEVVSVAKAKQGALAWSAMMDDSLRELQVDHVDAYYLMASNNTSVVANDEILGAFETAKAAGKVAHLGISTHENAANVLAAAAKTGAFSLAQIAITPAGWYDWGEKAILKGTAPMKDLASELAGAREAGIGLIGMKAGRYLAGRKFIGWGKAGAFDDYYDEKLLASNLSSFQRSYAFVLEHGLDAVNADMGNFAHLRENFAAAATSARYFA